MNTYSEDKMYESYSSEVERMQKCIDELLQENKILKEKYENAVADYETTMSELQELKKQLEEKENIACNWKDSCLENAGKIEKLENQQKEFILYLENEIYSIEPKGTGINYNCEYDSEEDYIRSE